jgi:hypothetical protein
VGVGVGIGFGVGEGEELIMGDGVAEGWKVSSGVDVGPMLGLYAGVGVEVGDCMGAKSGVFVGFVGIDVNVDVGDVWGEEEGVNEEGTDGVRLRKYVPTAIPTIETTTMAIINVFAIADLHNRKFPFKKSPFNILWHQLIRFCCLLIWQIESKKNCPNESLQKSITNNAKKNAANYTTPKNTTKQAVV